MTWSSGVVESPARGGARGGRRWSVALDSLTSSWPIHSTHSRALAERRALGRLEQWGIPSELADRSSRERWFAALPDSEGWLFQPSECCCGTSALAIGRGPAALYTEWLARRLSATS